jgi:hypothetical protein
MPRLIGALISGSITFMIGMLVTSAWSLMFPRQVSLCELARTPGAYDGKLVRVEALGSVTSSPVFSESYVIIVEVGCSESDGWASVQLDGSSRLTTEADEFVNSTRPESRRAKVVVEGRFDRWASLGCFSPKFGIKGAQITIVSPVITEPLPEKLSKLR